MYISLKAEHLHKNKESFFGTIPRKDSLHVSPPTAALPPGQASMRCVPDPS